MHRGHSKKYISKITCGFPELIDENKYNTYNTLFIAKSHSSHIEALFIE